jgi:hypothetical protein
MVQTKKSKEIDLKEIILSDDSNLNLPTVSYPSPYTTQPIKLGAKSIENKLASEHQLLEYQRRVSRKESILSSSEIRTLVFETNERRKALEQSINEQKQAFQQRRASELAARQARERAESRANRIAHENDTQRQIRISAEKEVKINRAKEIQTLQNKCRREKEEVETFFMQSSNRFNEKYGSPTLQIMMSGDTGIDRIISSRPFSTNRYAHRCVPCGYHSPESLSISKIYQHVYENKDQHMQFVLSEIDKYYNIQITETRRKHTIDDNPDLRQQKLSKDFEALKKLKGAKYL